MGRLDAMESFVRVAECHGFSEAARRLGLSKSVVSRQIAGLEAELGARLLHRTTRSLALTEVGQAYYERCLRILADIDEANQSVSSLQASPRGKLRLAAPVSFGMMHLAALIPLFLERFPDVSIDMAMSDHLVNLVEDGFDLAVRIGRLEDSSLIARQLAPIRRLVCASPAYLERRGQPQTPADLKNHCCLTYSHLAPLDEWQFTTADGKRWPVEVHGRLRVNNGHALRDAALAGVGLVMLPSFIVGADLQAGTLVPLLTDYVIQAAGLYAVYPHARHLSPKVRAFVDFLAEHFSPRPYWDLVE